jgi:PqqA peptide cyclase
MNGWGQKYISVNPVGDVLPCPTAGEIPSLTFDNVRDRSLGWIWEHSPAFNRFRGTDWMSAPCRTCENREIDFGGCRCQAALFTGDPTNTDPVCSLSSHHHLVQAVLGPKTSTNPVSTTANDWIYRINPVIMTVNPLEIRAHY